MHLGGDPVGRFRARGPLLLLLAFVGSAVAGRRVTADCTPFLRGDTDSSGSVTITDGVATLSFLFLGGEAPRCADAADADDSGDLSISDAVFTFGFLFLGGPPPPEPGVVVCGVDPTPFDGLDCRESSWCQEIAPTVWDRSDFVSFTYEQLPGFGFCPDPDRTYRARVARAAPDEYRLERSVLLEGEPGDPDCLPETFGPCLLEVHLEPRLLALEEVAAMRELFSELEVFEAEDPICACVVFDPCVILDFRWDDRRASNHPCSTPRVSEDTARRLLSLLDGLP